MIGTTANSNQLYRNCPRCKVPRKATKSLSIARLPPVLLIHLKRFTTTNGVFWDKSETPVIFPIKHLDLTRYIPPSPAQLDGKHPSGPVNPMSNTGPFLYDLFAISNDMGSLSNGHCEWRIHSASRHVVLNASSTLPSQIPRLSILQKAGNIAMTAKSLVLVRETWSYVHPAVGYLKSSH
jgi:ubiquitin C-terminal hydrolase